MEKRETETEGRGGEQKEDKADPSQMAEHYQQWEWEIKQERRGGEERDGEKSWKNRNSRVEEKEWEIIWRKRWGEERVGNERKKWGTRKNWKGKHRKVKEIKIHQGNKKRGEGMKWNKSKETVETDKNEKKWKRKRKER